MKKKQNSKIVNVHLDNLALGSVKTEAKYIDEELVFIDNIHDLPDFAACKVSFNVALYCAKGRLQAMIGSKEIHIHSGQIILVHSHVIVDEIMASPDIEFSVVCLSDRVLTDILQSQMGIWTRALYKNHYHIMDLPQDLIGFLNGRTMERIFKKDDSPFKQEILVCILRATFLTYCEELMGLPAGIQNEANVESTRSFRLFQAFISNVQCRHVKKRRVGEYAKELCISPKYLTAVCQKESGKSPSDWIEEFVVIDICYYLKNTALSSKQIANELGFATPSFFGKFVREHLGCTPTEYRQKTAKGD